MSAKCEYCGRFASEFDNVIDAHMTIEGLSVDEYLRCLRCAESARAAAVEPIGGSDERGDGRADHRAAHARPPAPAVHPHRHGGD